MYPMYRVLDAVLLNRNEDIMKRMLKFLDADVLNRNEDIMKMMLKFLVAKLSLYMLSLQNYLILSVVKTK